MIPRTLSLLTLVLSIITQAVWAHSPESGTFHKMETYLDLKDNRRIKATEGLIFVPENRENPRSRVIAVSFLHIKGISEKSTTPIFIVPGGPGGFFSQKRVKGKGNFEHLNILLKTGRDIVYVNHRGTSHAPWADKLNADMTPKPLDRVTNVQESMSVLTSDFSAAIEEWTARGVDLRGYNISEMVQDIEDVRTALGYDSIILNGTSFGSQWSLSYARTFPQNVDRMLLSGLEPLDYAYDDPEWLWNVIDRIEKDAHLDKDIAPLLPEGGFKAVVDTIFERLAKSPQIVTIRDPKSDETKTVTIGTFEFQNALRYPWPTGSLLEVTHHWPAFILRIYEGDYHDLAVLTYKEKTRDSRPLMPNHVDNSIGITAERDRLLLEKAGTSPFGDANWGYRATRKVTVSPVVNDDFRIKYDITMPTLIVQGDLDLSTPIENTYEALGHFKNAHVFEIVGGTHDALDEALELLPVVNNAVMNFLNSENAINAARLFDEFSEKVPLPRADFPAPTRAFPDWEVKN